MIVCKLLLNSTHANIAHEITKQLIQPYCPIQFIKERLPLPTSSLHLYTTNHIEVEKTIKSLKNTSPGTDKVSINILITSCEHTARPLATLVNQSFKEGSFLNDLKTSLITPIFKNSSKTLLTNYCLVSVLKLLENYFLHDLYHSYLSIKVSTPNSMASTSDTYLTLLSTSSSPELYHNGRKGNL